MLKRIPVKVVHSLHAVVATVEENAANGLSAKVPRGHWKTSTFIAALCHDCVTAPLLLDGPMTD